MKANIDDFFTNDAIYVKDKDDAEGMRALAKKKKNGKKIRSAKIAQYKCDAECGSNNDLHCSIANLRPNNLVSCCALSVRSLAFDLSHIHSIYPGEKMEDKVKRICIKNDRIFYIVIIVTFVLLFFFLIRLMGR